MPLLLLLLLVLSVPGNSQGDSSIKSFKIHSSILNEDRFFDSYLPPSSKKSLDVIYVLDGQAQFRNVVNTLKILGEEKIVIGIGNIWLRDRDYTPTHVNAGVYVDSTAAAISGGCEKFISHLEKELIPYINSNFPADATRIIVGHSLGGLTALYILLRHEGLFQNFVLIDPSMWWDDSNLLKQTNELLKKTSVKIELFLAIANTANKNKNNIEAIRADNTTNTAQIRPGIILLDYLKAASKKNILLDWKYYKDQSHMSVFQPAVLDGLRFLSH